MVKFIHAGLATAYGERVRCGDHYIEVARLTITDAGRQGDGLSPMSTRGINDKASCNSRGDDVGDGSRAIQFRQHQTGGRRGGPEREVVVVQNEKVRQRTLLEPMLRDGYFPNHLVKKAQRLLLELAARIEQEAPQGEAVYALTHATTKSFNQLQEEFFEANSEIETVAREAIAAEFRFILEAYGYDVDIETAIAPRDW